MSKGNGFLQHRRGIWEHVRDGRLSLQDVAIHQYIAAQADTRTGVWNGSAGALAGELCISPRVARRVLERLTQGNYIRRFPATGKHVCYPILVHKFEITDGEHRGDQLNALASTSSVDLRYFPGEHRGEHLSSQKKLDTRSKQQTLNPATKSTPPAAANPNSEDSVWTFLRINPCGPISFRSLLESRWASRGADRPSDLIGGTVDAWEEADGAKLGRAPQLFRALSELRRRERLDEQKPVEGAEPIHTLTAEEIPV